MILLVHSAQRRERLHLVVDNSRFLLLPWVHGKNLASQILATAGRRLPGFWQRRYNYKPLLLESFVEKQRFAGNLSQGGQLDLCGPDTGPGQNGTAAMVVKNR